MDHDAGLAALATGLAFGLSLIVAVGPQNLFVFHQGLRRQYVALIVSICSLADILLVVTGIAGMGLVIGRSHWLLQVARIGGATFVFVTAALIARRLRRGRPVLGEVAGAEASRRSVLAACLAFTFLNPAVYLDTVVLVGSVANADRGHHQWWFGAGACAASALWFVALGFGARLLAPAFSRPWAWWWFDAFSVAVLTLVGLRVILTT